ncbi:hypothetical protein L0Y69_00390 [bacterium]|nr:hypothetical protein [bacterium]
MSPEDENKEEPSRIEELEKKLYSRDENAVRPHKRTELHPKKFYLAEDWDAEKSEESFLARSKKPPAEKISFYSKLFAVSLIFFFAASGLAGYFLFSERNFISPENVELSMFGPVSVKGGDVLDLQIVIENKNTAPLAFANLVLQFPDDSRLASDSSKAFLRYSKPLGEILPGEIRTETIKVILLGDERTRKEVRASLSYGISGSNATYTKENKYAVTLTAPPLAVSIDLLKEANAGQVVTLTANIESNASSPLKDPIVRIDYPVGFVLQSATPSPSSGKNIWRLGPMVFGDKREIRITGVLLGEDNQEKAFWVYTGLSKSDSTSSIGTLFSSILQTVTLKKPFLGVDIFVNGESDPEYTLPSRKDKLNLSIRWTNNLADRIINGEIQAVIKGDTVDKRTMSVDRGGFFRSSEDLITWERRTTPALVSIARGKESTVGVSFGLLPAETEGFVRKNPVIEIEVSVKGERVSEDNVPEEIRSFAKRSIKVGTTAVFSSRALHWSGPFENTGPMPPQVDQETTYTVVWSVENLSSNLSGTRMRATLPPYVHWIGQVFPNTPGLIYNDVSGDVVWEAGNVSAGTGVETPLKEVAFQIAIVPSLSQVSASPNILSATTFSAEDTFTGRKITGTLFPINTQLLTDPTFISSQSAVIP